MSDDVNGDGTGEDTDAFDYEGDAMLNLIVHLVEKGISIGVTLYTQGLVFSGRLISRRDFFERNFTLAGGAEGILAPLFQEALKAIDAAEPNDGQAPDYRYVHMDGSTWAPGNEGMPKGGALSRIERSQIIGWSLGNFST